MVPTSVILRGAVALDVRSNLKLRAAVKLPPVAPVKQADSTQEQFRGLIQCLACTTSVALCWGRSFAVAIGEGERGQRLLAIGGLDDVHEVAGHGRRKTSSRWSNSSAAWSRFIARAHRASGPGWRWPRRLADPTAPLVGRKRSGSRRVGQHSIASSTTRPRPSRSILKKAVAAVFRRRTIVPSEHLSGSNSGSEPLGSSRPIGTGRLACGSPGPSPGFSRYSHRQTRVPN